MFKRAIGQLRDSPRRSSRQSTDSRQSIDNSAAVEKSGTAKEKHADAVVSRATIRLADCVASCGRKDGWFPLVVAAQGADTSGEEQGSIRLGECGTRDARGGRVGLMLVSPQKSR